MEEEGAGGASLTFTSNQGLDDNVRQVQAASGTHHTCMPASACKHSLRSQATVTIGVHLLPLLPATAAWVAVHCA